MSDGRVARARMVAEQLRPAGIEDPAVLAAMQDVPRHLFVPRLLRHRAYQPCALPIGFGQTISQPFTVALMTSLLNLHGGERVLEIGTGSGYQAAVLSRLCGEVISLERIAPLAQRARSVLADLRYANVSVHAADGTTGRPEDAPYDAILVTACVPSLPDPLLWQLADGGVLLLPVGRGERQVLYRYQRRGEEVAVQRSVACRFVPLQPGLQEGSARA